MCPNCFNILSTFNETKQTWLNNQQILIESNGELISEEIEVQDENLERYEVEYVDEVEEHELISENHDEGSQDECVNRRKYEKKKTERTASEKAKEVYKSLLKKCEECGKMIEKNRLEGHINKHLGKKPFICEFKNCGKAFYCRLLRRLHQTSIHTGTLVACEQCEKTFKSERSLYTHSLRHRNANRYKCDHCEKSFNNSNSLKRHLAIHSGVREWKCDQCSSSFYRKFNLGNNLYRNFKEILFTFYLFFRCSRQDGAREREIVQLSILHEEIWIFATLTCSHH